MEIPEMVVFKNVNEQTRVDPESCSLNLSSTEMDAVIVTFFDLSHRGTFRLSSLYLAME
jgi:hypothetical protein